MITYLVRSRAERAGERAADRQDALDDITTLISRLPDSIEKDEAIRLATSLLGLSRHGEEGLRRASASGSAEPVGRGEVAAEGRSDSRSERERRLLALALARPGLARGYLVDLPDEALSEEPHRRAAALIASGERPEAWPAELRALGIALEASAAGAEPSEAEIREAAYRVQLPVLQRRARQLRERGDEAGMLEVLELERALRDALRGRE